MNIKQRAVLIIGGIVLVIALITTPQYQMIDGTKFKANYVPEITNQYDLNNAILRTAIIIAIFIPMFYVLKTKE